MTHSPRNQSVFVSDILVLYRFIVDQTINQVYAAPAPSKAAPAPSKIDFLAGDAVQIKL